MKRESKRPQASRTQKALPLYASLTKRLMDEIGSGEYPVGSLLPTEHELADRYSVSRQTVREALRHLAESGVVSRRPRVGTRVERDKAVTRYSMSVDSITDFSQYGKQAPLRLDTIEPVEARGQLAERLGCREGTRWLHLLGVRYGKDGAAVAVSETWLRDEYPGVERKLRTLRGMSINAMLERFFGERVNEIQQEIHAVSISARDAGVLGVAEGTPGLEVHRRFLAQGGRLVVTGRVLHPGDRFSYSSRFLRESPENPVTGR